MDMKDLDFNLNEILKYTKFGGDPRVFFQLSKYYMESLLEELERTIKSPMNNENLLNTYLAIRLNPNKGKDPYIAKLPKGAGDDYTLFFIEIDKNMPLDTIQTFIHILNQANHEGIIFKEATEYSNDSLIPVVKKETTQVNMKPVTARLLFRLGVLDEFINIEAEYSRRKTRDFSQDSYRVGDLFVITTSSVKAPTLNEIMTKKKVDPAIPMDGSGIKFKFAA